MSKHYHATLATGLGLVVVGLIVALSPQGLLSGQGGHLAVSSVQAEESHDYGSDGYDSDGYDHDGYDRDGYDREGYSDDGHDHDGDYDADHDRDSPTGGSAQAYKVKPTVKQY